MNEQNDLQPNEQIQSSKNIWIIIASVILTALIIGSGVFWWQKTIFQTEQRKFQKQLVLVNNQLELVRPENEKLTEQIAESKLTATNENVIDEPVSNKGWKKFNSGGELVFSTENWSSYPGTKDNFSFSIEYPGEWQYYGSVFHDSNGNKIAEFLPGLVFLSPNQKCFDVNEVYNEEDNGDGESKLISRTNIVIGDKIGVLKIYETGTKSGIWYPNIFCLSEGEKAFVMSFYEHELGAGDKELFEKILATLKFE